MIILPWRGDDALSDSNDEALLAAARAAVPSLAQTHAGLNFHAGHFGRGEGSEDIADAASSLAKCLSSASGQTGASRLSGHSCGGHASRRTSLVEIGTSRNSEPISSSASTSRPSSFFEKGTVRSSEARSSSASRSSRNLSPRGSKRESLNASFRQSQTASRRGSLNASRHGSPVGNRRAPVEVPLSANLNHQLLSTDDACEEQRLMPSGIEQEQAVPTRAATAPKSEEARARPASARATRPDGPAAIRSAQKHSSPAVSSGNESARDAVRGGRGSRSPFCMPPTAGAKAGAARRAAVRAEGRGSAEGRRARCAASSPKLTQNGECQSSSHRARPCSTSPAPQKGDSHNAKGCCAPSPAHLTRSLTAQNSSESNSALALARSAYGVSGSTDLAARRSLSWSDVSGRPMPRKHQPEWYSGALRSGQRKHAFEPPRRQGNEHVVTPHLQNKAKTLGERLADAIASAPSLPNCSETQDAALAAAISSSSIEQGGVSEEAVREARAREIEKSLRIRVGTATPWHEKERTVLQRLFQAHDPEGRGSVSCDGLMKILESLGAPASRAECREVIRRHYKPSNDDGPTVRAQHDFLPVSTMLPPSDWLCRAVSGEVINSCQGRLSRTMREHHVESMAIRFPGEGNLGKGKGWLSFRFTCQELVTVCAPRFCSWLVPPLQILHLLAPLQQF
eukprot:6189496-Pleurochrysis_carterae.AAC.2